MWCWLEAHPGLAAWFGSIGTLSAVIVAGITIFLQHKNALAAERTKRNTDEAMTVLSLWYLAKEIRQMITLAAHQIDQPGNFVFYPDISAEFSSVRYMLEQLPLERIAARACVGEWHTLRRVATELSKAYQTAPRPGDGFIFEHRNRFAELQKICRSAESEISESLKKFDPLLHKEHEPIVDLL